MESSWGVRRRLRSSTSTCSPGSWRSCRSCSVSDCNPRSRRRGSLEAAGRPGSGGDLSSGWRSEQLPPLLLDHSEYLGAEVGLHPCELVPQDSRPSPDSLSASELSVRRSVLQSLKSSVRFLRILVNRVEEGFVIGNLFCKFRTLRVNRMSLCEGAASSSCKVSSVASFLFF